MLRPNLHDASGIGSALVGANAARPFQVVAVDVAASLAVEWNALRSSRPRPGASAEQGSAGGTAVVTGRDDRWTLPANYFLPTKVP